MYAKFPSPPLICVYENFPQKFNLNFTLISVKKVQNVINVCCLPNNKPIAYCLIKLSILHIKWSKVEVKI
jgi:hypothetical protein